MGTTVGICSVVGFLPDVFVYPIVGHWQDTLPAAEAYRNMWLMGLAATSLVIIFTFLLFRKIRAFPIAAERDGEKLQEISHVE